MFDLDSLDKFCRKVLQFFTVFYVLQILMQFLVENAVLIALGGYCFVAYLCLSTSALIKSIDLDGSSVQKLKDRAWWGMFFNGLGSLLIALPLSVIFVALTEDLEFVLYGLQLLGLTPYAYVQLACSAISYTFMFTLVVCWFLHSACSSSIKSLGESWRKPTSVLNLLLNIIPNTKNSGKKENAADWSFGGYEVYSGPKADQLSQESYKRVAEMLLDNLNSRYTAIMPSFFFSKNSSGYTVGPIKGEAPSR